MDSYNDGDLDVEATTERVKSLIATEMNLSPALKSSLEVLLLLVTILANRSASITRTAASRHRRIPIVRRSPSTLPVDHYREVGFESRQVIDLDIAKLVTEYRVQILEDSQGQHYVAPFPTEPGITSKEMKKRKGRAAGHTASPLLGSCQIRVLRL